MFLISLFSKNVFASADIVYFIIVLKLFCHTWLHMKYEIPDFIQNFISFYLVC